MIRNGKKGMNRPSDRALWQRSRTTEAPEDEAARFLDLAAFADGLLDTDERERVAALLETDPAAAADVAAARGIILAISETRSGLDRIVARACSAVPSAPALPGRVVAFAPRRRRVLQALTQWGSLAAAIAVASWLGFAMGSDASLALSQPAQTRDVGFLPELLDPGTGFLRDLGEGVRG